MIVKNKLKENTQTKKIYDGKFFYEVVRGSDNQEHRLIGPLDNIRYATLTDKKENNEYPYLQVIDGQVRTAFKYNEIAILDFDIRLQSR
jgi:hypothetical protein